jgi:glycolate oxidase FAD binding subunit
MSGAVVAPSNEAEAASFIAGAMHDRTPLEIIGGGGLRGVGGAANAATTLSSRALSGIVAYQPTEMVMTARSGTPLADIEAALDQANQMLAFEPPSFRALLGASGAPTIGSVAAANLSGPRRFVAGAARDALIGVRFVNGSGGLIRNGGRVMKNVTGLDLVKLMAGSWGTLGFLTEVTFKVQPKPASESTLCVTGLSDEAAMEALAAALGTHCEVSGAAHLPEIASNGLPGGRFKGEAATLMRLSGDAASVNERVAFLKGRFGDLETLVLAGEESRAAWRAVRDAAIFAPAGPDPRPVWRVSMAPSQGWRMVDALRREAGLLAWYDWQGGLIWLRMEAGAEAQHLRRMISIHGGGHATLLRRGRDDAGAAAFEPQDALTKALQQRIKAAFDPAGIFNPGRMGF